jgi:glycosyltransferase involved in cell wall biosynthesis
MKPSHIYLFAHYNLKGPCVRYRGKYFLEALSRIYGISSSFVMPGYQPKNILHFIKVYFSALLFRKSDSIIVFQKIYTQGIYANALKFLLFFRKKGTIYDLDDAYHLKFPPVTIFHFLQHTTLVSVGSEELLKFASLHNNRVFINTSPIITHPYIKTKKNGIFTIGWIGFYNAHSESLEQLFFPALRHSALRVRLVMMGVTKSEHKNFLRELFPVSGNVNLEITEGVDWEDELQIYHQISRFDVGVSPLLETGLNMAKSAFKMKQYLSAGVPVLASPVGENCRFLKHGYNGYFCDNPQEFYTRIKQFYEMPDELYHHLSIQALESSAGFSMEQYCHTFLDNLNNYCTKV